MSVQTLTSAQLEKSLSIRDLSDPGGGKHAIQLLISEAHEALSKYWGNTRLLYRCPPVVSVAQNYDDLGYPKEGAARAERYSRYLAKGLLLRTQASAAIPVLLRALALDPPGDLLLVCPAMVYRRDVIDRIHVAEPHHLDLWRIRRGHCTVDDLNEMIGLVVSSLLPNRQWRTLDTSHPYTQAGQQIEVLEGSVWIEIGECGIADPALLNRCGLDSNCNGGLAMGLGLDRLLMLRKGIPDIRLLRSEDARVKDQMLDLEPYKPVSPMPQITRDLSVAVERYTDSEILGDSIRAALGDEADLIEQVAIKTETTWAELPAGARDRMGMGADQKNLLLRLIVRHPTKTLTRGQANALRDRVYLAIHRGSRHELAIDAGSDDS